MNNDYKKDCDSIFSCAKTFASKIQNELNIPSMLIFYEELMFTYFLKDIRLVELEKPESYRTLVLTLIKKLLESCFENNEKYIQDIFISRIETYAKCLEKADYDPLSTKFFYKAFEYQNELISYIKINNKFSTYNLFPESPMEYTKKTANSFSSVSKISDLLINNVDILIDFYNN